MTENALSVLLFFQTTPTNRGLRQKAVYFPMWCRSKWRAGTRETEVKLDRWCEGGLGQHRNDGGLGGGCETSETMRERSKRVESTGRYICIIMDLN